MLSGAMSAPRLRDNLQGLTGLRILAALAVYFSHVRAPAGSPPVVQSFFDAGYYGVTVFFVLSGFVLAYNYFDRLEHPTARGIWSYGVARFARVYPMYLLVLLFLLAQLSASGEPLPDYTLTHLLALQAWHPDVNVAYALNGPGWSIGVEFFLYATLPFLIPLVARLDQGIRPLAIAVAVTIAVMVTVTAWFIATGRADLSIADPASAHRWLYRMPLMRVGDFILGILAARLFLRLRARDGIDRLGTRMAYGAFIAIGLLAAAGFHLLSAPSFDLSYAVAAFFLILGLALAPMAKVTRFLALPAMVLLGEASYAFYLIHVPMIDALGGRAWSSTLDPATLFLTLAVLVAIAATAIGLHILVEGPARTGLRRLLDRRPVLMPQHVGAVAVTSEGVVMATSAPTPDEPERAIDATWPDDAGIADSRMVAVVNPAQPDSAARPSQGAGFRTSSVRGPRWTVAGWVPVIALVLLGGLALRLLLGLVLFPQDGLWSDIKLFADWSLTLADNGPGKFYTEVYWSDYTPGYLWVLWVYGVVMKTVAQLTGGAAPDLIPLWLKLPAILGDLLVAWIFYRAIRRWHSERWGVIVAAVYLFVPVTWYDSALWGQVDTMGVLVGGLALIWLIDRKPELATAAAVAAVLVKPQFGIFVPVVGLVLLRWYMRRPGELGWLRDPAGPIRLVTSAVAGFVTLVLMIVPFDLETRVTDGLATIPVVADIRGLLALVQTTAGSYNFLTANAFNPWAMVGPTPLTNAIGGDYIWTYDSLDIFGVTAAFLGTALFVVVALGVAVLLYRRQDRDAILVAATTLAVAFFVLPTKVHERYLFAAVGIGLLLLPRSRGWWAWFAAAAGVLLVNMHAVLSLPFRGYGTPAMQNLPFADFSRTPFVVTLTAITSAAVLAWPLIEGFRMWRAGPLPDVPASPGGSPSTDIEPVADDRPPSRTFREIVSDTTLRIPGIGTGATIGLLALASLVMAVFVNRLTGLGPEWIWNWDTPQGYYPNSVMFHDALVRGGLPLWIDRIGLGYPLAVGGQTGAFYPPNWVTQLLPTLQALNVTRLLHLTLAGTGAGLIVLRLTGVRSAALVTALIAVGCGGVVAKLEWIDLIAAYAWIPWILLPLLWNRRPPGLGAVTLAGVLWGVQALAGFPPIWALTGIAVGVLLLVQRRSWRAIGPIALFGVIGVGVGALQLLPTLVLLPLSVRSTGLDLGQLFRFSATPVDALGFAFANAFAPATSPAWDLTRTWYPGGTWGFLESSAYVGLAVLAMAVVGVRIRRARIFLVIAVVMLIIPIIGVFQPAIWGSIPGLSGLRHPVRAYLLVDLMAALAAGVAFARLGRPQRIGPAAVVLGALIALYLLVLGIAALAPDQARSIIGSIWGFPIPGREEEFRQLIVTTLTSPLPVLIEVVLCVAVLALLTRRMARPVARLAVGAMLVLPFALFLPGVNQLRPLSAFDWASDPLVVAVKATAPNRLLALNPPGQGYANQFALAGLRDLNVFSSLDLAGTDETISAIRAGSVDLARLLGVDTFIAWDAASCPIGQPIATVPERNAAICRLDGVRTGPLWIPADLVAGAATESGGLGLRPTIATADPTAVLAAAKDAVTVARDDGSGSFTIDAPADGYLLIDRAWYPGWQTTVDGQPAPVSQLFGVQLVPVTAGSHLVEQSLVPRDIQAGLLITLLTLAAVGVGAAIVGRRRFRPALERVQTARAVEHARRARLATLAAAGTATTATATAPATAPATADGGHAAAARGAPARRSRRRRLLNGHVGRRGFMAVVLFTLAMTGVRLYHLERPLGWYFDEDLHGRTATEFLQDWRYGMPHDILEWTHPHLSKYLQAAAVEAIGGNEVSRTLPVGVDVVAAALEPFGTNNSTTAPSPSRLIVASSEQLVVRELTGEQRTIALPIDGIDQLSVQPQDRLAWAATTGGSLLRMDLAQLDDDAPETDVPFIENVGELDAPVDGLWALPSGGVAVLSADTLSLWGPDGNIGERPAAGLTDVVLVGADDAPRLALLLPDGVHVVSFPDLAEVSRIALNRRPLGADLADGSDYENRARDVLPDPRLYVATRGGVASIGGMAGDALFVEDDIPMPGFVRDVAWNPSTNMIHVLGEQDGRATIYVIEPHGNAVFADAELPGDPVAWALDWNRQAPANDRQVGVTIDATGQVAEVGLAGSVFATRFPGAVLGGIAAGLLLLLLMWLVASRAAAVIGAVLIASETMLYAESRIATPDTMTIAFLVGAWAMLAWMLSRTDLRRRRWTVILGFPTVGLLLGLAASTKWTGFYGFAGVLLFLLLVNPRLRLLAIGAALLATIGLSLMSLAGPTPNLQLVGVLVAATALLWAWRNRWGSEPMGDDDLLPIRHIAWALVSIPLVGLVVYVALFIPWTFLSLGDPQMIAGWPAGHTGETFLQLQQRMYAFHDGLTQPHGAGTPWWAWPLMLKPLWAYLDSFGEMAATIVMPANPVVVWMSLPVAVWAIWRLLRGFSAPLLLLLAAFAVQWLPWVRVERVAFFYHYATAIPFALALLALFLARVRRGVSPRGWIAVRAGAIALLLYPAISWLMTGPLCSTLTITPTADICGSGWNEQIQLDILLGVVALVVAVSVTGLVLANRWSGLAWADRDARQRMLAEGFVGVMAVLATALGAIAVGRSGVLDSFIVSFTSPMLAALVCAAAAAPFVILTAGARSPARFVAGVLLAAVTIAALLYPVVSGAVLITSPMPFFAQSLLPTWETAFQFASGPGGILEGALLLGLPLILVAGVAFVAIRELDRRRA